MSKKHAAALNPRLETSAESVDLPSSVEAFEAALLRERALALRCLDLERDIEAHRQALEADYERRVAQETERRVAAQIAAAVEAGIKAGVAAGVAEKVQQILEQWRLARHKQFGPSSESHQGDLFNEVEALVDLAADTEDEHTGSRTGSFACAS